MRNLVWGFLGIVLLYTYASCKKDSGCGYSSQDITAPLNEQQAVKSYLSSNNITNVQKDSSGFYYQIVEEGSGGVPNLCSQVEVSYTGKLTNGTTFDSTTTYFTLGALIEGWKKGLPLIQKSGHLKLYVPPTLGYGSKDYPDASHVLIPANSVLIFDIKLNGFN